MDVCTLASGSSGNSLLICCGSTYVLLDAGISARRITSALKALGADPTRLSAVLVTHEHTDHVSGLATLTKQLGVPVYATAPTLDRLERKVPALARLGRALEAGTGFQLGELWVESFSTPHDAAGSVGYAVTGGGARMALATDLGHLTPQVWDAAQGADLLVCETNHDEDWVRSGPYPYALKQRILGDFGHLSNEAGAELAGRAALAGTRTILLAHLSSENNTPARAREVVSRRLSARGGHHPGGSPPVGVRGAVPAGAGRSSPGLSGKGGIPVLSVYLICVGKLKEKFYQEACAEYIKRLSPYCRLTLVELPEEKLPQDPSQAQIDAALEKESQAIRAKLPPSTSLVCLCVEGRLRSSEELSALVGTWEHSSAKHLAFVIGGSYGLAERLKGESWVKLSMSPMTFPHHLARVMLLEQLYRAFKIREGSSYHK